MCIVPTGPLAGCSGMLGGLASLSGEYLAVSESRVIKSGMVQHKDAVRDDIHCEPIWDAAKRTGLKLL